MIKRYTNSYDSDLWDPDEIKSVKLTLTMCYQGKYEGEVHGSCQAEEKILIEGGIFDTMTIKL